jgi:hypothetical protein
MPATNISDAPQTDTHAAAPHSVVPSARRLYRVVLHLARCHDFPEGSALHGYAFEAPLGADGHLDPRAWSELRERCHVRRFWGDEPDRVGHLVHRRGGAGGATWCFAYSDARGQDIEEGHHLQEHQFVAGDYVSIRQDDGHQATFEIIEVSEIRP